MGGGWNASVHTAWCMAPRKQGFDLLTSCSCPSPLLIALAPAIFAAELKAGLPPAGVCAAGGAQCVPGHPHQAQPTPDCDDGGLPVVQAGPGQLSSTGSTCCGTRGCWKQHVEWQRRHAVRCVCGGGGWRRVTTRGRHSVRVLSSSSNGMQAVLDAHRVVNCVVFWECTTLVIMGGIVLQSQRQSHPRAFWRVDLCLAVIAAAACQVSLQQGSLHIMRGHKYLALPPPTTTRNVLTCFWLRCALLCLLLQPIPWRRCRLS